MAARHFLSVALLITAITPALADEPPTIDITIKDHRNEPVTFLEIAGVATVLPRPVWDTADLLSDSSVFGKVLNTLIGYNDHPTMLQVLVYLTTLASILMMMRFFGTATRKQALA